MLDWEGNMIDKKDRMQILLTKKPEKPETPVTAMICKAEANVVYEILKRVPLLAPKQ